MYDRKKGTTWFQQTVTSWLESLPNDALKLGEDYDLLRLLTKDLTEIQGSEKSVFPQFYEIVLDPRTLSSPDEAHEVNQNGKYYCDRLGAACDFRVVGMESDLLVEWILEQRLPFDSLYFYGRDRSIHIRYRSHSRREIWAFSEKGTPTKKGIESWAELARKRAVS